MLKLNRDSVLKSFMEKVNEAKRLRMKDVKMTLKEIDDLAQVIYELMTEQISNALIRLEEMKEEEITKKDIKLPKKRRVIEKIEFDKEPEEKVIEPINMVVKEEPKVQPIPTKVVVEEPKPLIKNVQPTNIVEEPENENEEEDDNTLYGGTW